MKIKKTLAILASSALALTMGAFALTGCSDAVKGDPYPFEAEDAVLVDPDGAANKMTIETKTEWTGTEEEGDEATNIGYFSTAGQTITWNVTAAEACTVTIKLRASSCLFGVKSEGTFYPMAEMGGVQADEYYIGELKAEDCGAVLKVNGTEAKMSGVLPGTSAGVADADNPWGMFAMFNIVHYGEFTAQVKLNKGENAIVLENVSASFNVDKITVYSEVKLTFTKTDNSDRVPAANPWSL